LKKRFVTLLLLCAVAICAAALAIFASADESADKIRVGYIQSEEYSQFGECIAGIAFGLRDAGLISGLALSADEDDARTVWNALSACDSERFLFVEPFFFSMLEMEERGEGGYAKLLNSPEVDLIFAVGTVAGVYLTENEASGDFMVFASANPVLAGIVKSETERVAPNSWAYVDANRMARQAEIAWNVFGFHNVGVVYEDNPSAYAYSGIAQLKDKAELHGFTVTEKHVDESSGADDDERYYTELKSAYAELQSEGIDALYITTATIAAPQLPWLLEDLNKGGIAVFSQSGGAQLEYGAMLGVTLDDFPDEGRYIAALLRRYADGTPLNALPQTYEIVPHITFNYTAARNAGIQVPYKTLLMFDKIIVSQ
jgi:ABC-type uncharacterized transport system substrate-binding protein